MASPGPAFAGRGFHKPKVYDPALASRQTGAPTGVLRGSTCSNSNNPLLQQSMRRGDFGFDEPEGGPGTANPPTAKNEWEENYKELKEQMEELRAHAGELKAACETAKTNDARTSQKLQSFQQVNRSQSALVRAELQKCRRRLAHTQAVAGRLKEQAEWFQQQSPGLDLPMHLRGFPTEEDASEDNAELVQMHERWEKDLAQLQAELLSAENRPPPSHAATPAELQEARQRIAELEGLAKRHREDAERHAVELDQLRRCQAGAQPGPAPPPAVAAADGGCPPTPGGGDAALLRKELVASEEKAKEQTKKLKQLATLYKKLDQEKGGLESKLKDAEAALEAAKGEAATAKVPSRVLLPVETVRRVHSALAAGRAQIAELKKTVASDLKQQLPAMMEAAINSKMPEIQQMIEDGCKEWREKYTIECERRRKLHNIVQELKGNIRVYCRVRPLNAHESGSCISFPSPDEIQIRNESAGMRKTWQFNEVFPENTKQEQVFASIRDLVVSMVDGYYVCIFAYGQTGAGKTHSMQGTKNDVGIYQRTFNELFKVAEERKGWKIELKGSLLEIYIDEIRDLLLAENDKRPKLTVRQNKDGSNYVPNLTAQPVKSVAEVEALLETGQRNRTVAATDMNAHSSRSHLLLQIHGSMTTPDDKHITSCITLVDLAGCEKLAKSGVEGHRAKEAISINKSLSALGDVINARATKNGHTPFRNSTLTHMLQDSLSGDAKTLMLLQINPCQDYVDESLNSLQFGGRVNAVEMNKK